MARLFFALWPDAGARAALAAKAGEVARRCGGRPVPAENLHLTLAFLGEVDPGAMPALRDAAPRVRSKPFELALDQLGAFSRAQVAWAGCRRPPAALLGLQSALARQIRDAGIGLDERPFAVHLTLARRIRAPLAPQAMEPVRWRVESFALVESVRGEGAYRTVGEWALEGEKN